MKTLSTIFNISMLVALAGWIFLFIHPYGENTDKILIYGVATVLSIFYAGLLFKRIHMENRPKYPKGDFKSLEGVVNLFKRPQSVLVGWIHYLAFDLMVGIYIKNDALASGIPFWYLIPSLILTIMFGPFGFLSYIILKMIIINT